MKKSDAQFVELLAGTGREVAGVIKAGLVVLGSNQVFSILAALAATQWLTNHYYAVETGEYDEVWVSEKGHWSLNPATASLAPGSGMGGGSPPIPLGGYEAPAGHYQPGPGQQIGAGGAIVPNYSTAVGGGGGYTSWDTPAAAPDYDLSGPIISIDALPREDYW